MGELLIDMIQADGDMTFKAHPGGAPANVAVGICRLGEEAAFMGRVGDDSLGNFLEVTLKKNNVDTQGLKRGGKTGMALVSLDNKGERSFQFYEELITYRESDVNTDVLDRTKIFHFGSISLIKNPEKTATLKCLNYAKSIGITISYDPNLRLNLWSDAESAREGIKTGLKYADILKVSDEELEFLTGEKDSEKGVKRILESVPNVKLVNVTLGAAGCYTYYKGKGKTIPTIKADVVDTTGAGDGFVAGLLYGLSQIGGLDNMEWGQLEKIVKIANTVGSITTMKKGAITALPTIDEVNKYIL
jgi:fructokinase